MASHATYTHLAPEPGARPGPDPHAEGAAPAPATEPIATELPPRPAGRRARAWYGALVWAGVGIVLGIWASGGVLAGPLSTATLAGSAGRLTALLASYLLLVQVLLIARIPAIERAFGQDGLARTHAGLGVTSVTMLAAHLVLSTFAESTSLATLLGTAWDMVRTWPGMLLATAATVALGIVMVSSIRAVRTRLRYETWHLLHLYAYLGVFLAVPHQLKVGTDFEQRPWISAFWLGLWVLAAAALLAFRVGLPLWRTWRHRLVVESVTPRASGVTTVTVTGRHLDRLHVEAGQFFQWRFLGQPGWTRAHPYSLSAAPDGRRLEISVAAVGDGSAALAHVPPGTRVAIEGPYGRLHHGARTRRRVVLFACGIGVAPMKALLEGMPQRPGEVTLIYRAGQDAPIPLLDELTAAAEARGADLRVLAGGRAERGSWLPQSWAHLSDAEAIEAIAPDITGADIYVCGSGAWMEHVFAALDRLGVDPAQVHCEYFDL